MKQYFLVTIESDEEVLSDEVKYYLKCGIHDEINHTDPESSDYEYLHQLEIIAVIDYNEKPTLHVPKDIMNRQMR